MKKMQSDSHQDNHSAIRTLCLKLSAAVVMMFVFAIWVMPPMYDLFCEVTGLNGKTGERYEVVDADGVDRSRTIKVQFLASNNEGMPWSFYPKIRSIDVHPGEPTVINYFAHNPTSSDMVAQAVPSVVPYKAASYFHKTECFCFNRQPLAGGDSTDLGLSFIIDRDIPKQVHTITLSYTLFDISKNNKSDEVAVIQQAPNH